MNIKKGISCFLSFLLISLLIGNNITVYGKDLTPSARYVLAMDRNSKQVLYNKNGYMPVPMASTTKIMTALITLQNKNLNEKVVISKNAASIRGSTVGFRSGEEISIHELVFGLMTRSGNDAAIALAEAQAGSVENFAKVMSSFATSLGLMDAHFESPHGLDSQNHYSSAYDMALLTSVAMQNEKFREIAAVKELRKEKYGFTRDYTNINKILHRIPEANGVKTGYTGQAGKCLVSSVNLNGRDIIIVVFNCPDRWEATAKVYDYIKENYDFHSVAVSEAIGKEAVEKNGYNPESKIDFVLPKGKSYKIDYTDFCNKKGEIGGKVTVVDSDGNEVIKKYVNKK
ncbi:D-alanyl-D-alanine carboxypeptidase [Clostridium folliculivorans]|uniref:D-alanyl-D-alanine carboxypeptidase n=1 Tax=Clostridium folliculivorans TaxID=2886038 RepID=A0A9W5XZR0_9CLOT|nr:D-alanyl-D-alanine carboxypeptidase family protein [Clostridium folliculivorans]GKU24021.1 D-alanyl-D-alanine carboxypeptidase [Clostridium folliculivorans]